MDLKYHFESETFRAAWEEWKIWRKVELKKGYKSILGEQYGLTHLNKVSLGNEEMAILIMHQSMGNRWQGFFPLKIANNGQTNNNQSAGTKNASRGDAQSFYSAITGQDNQQK